MTKLINVLGWITFAYISVRVLVFVGAIGKGFLAALPAIAG